MDDCLIATEAGLWRLRRDAIEPVDTLAGRTISALAVDGSRTWAVADGRSIHLSEDGTHWEPRAAIDGPPVTCLAATPVGLLLGSEQAHVLRLTEHGAAMLDTFETVPGRDAWYTPWGDPAGVRSIAVGADGTLYVNVHVGGVVRSCDGGRSWTPTVDIEVDVHQVLTHPTSADTVFVAAAIGFGITRDGGDSWRFATEGLHAHYARAVAIAGDLVLVSASRGPGGRQAALYRRSLDDTAAFERCRDGLPEWLGDNIDTACLAASGRLVIFGTDDGRVFRSDDSGQRWHATAKGLPPVRAVVIR